MTAAGIGFLVLVQIFCRPLLLLFGGTPEVMPYAETYTRITVIGMPLMMAVNGMSHIARADGSPRFSMLCLVTGAVVNTVLDPIFIFGFGWGVAGAAWATVISQAVSFLIALAYIPRFKQIRLTRRIFRPQPAVMRRIAAYGMSNSINQLSLTFVQIVLNNTLAYYGAMSEYGSDIPLAACGIVLKCNAVLLGFIIGISQGSQPIIGFNYGAGRYARVRGIYRLAVTCDIVIATVGFLIFQLFPRQIISLFGTGDPLYFEFASRFMRIYLLMLPVNGVQMLSSNFFSAIGKPLKGAFLSLSRQVLFLIPLILLFSFFWGTDGILFSAPVADLTAFLVTTVFVMKELARMRRLEKERL